MHYLDIHIEPNINSITPGLTGSLICSRLSGRLYVQVKKYGELSQVQEYHHLLTTLGSGGQTKNIHKC